MNYYCLGDTVVNLDLIQFITIEERDEDGLPIMAKIHFASIGPAFPSSQVVIAESFIYELFKAIRLEKDLFPVLEA